MKSSEQPKNTKVEKMNKRKKNGFIALSITFSIAIFSLGIFLLFYYIADSIVLVSCATPRSCREEIEKARETLGDDYHENPIICPSSCEKITLWDVVSGDQKGWEIYKAHCGDETLCDMKDKY